MTHWRWYQLGITVLVAALYTVWGYPIPLGYWPFLMLLTHWALRHEIVAEPPWDIDAELDGWLGRG